MEPSRPKSRPPLPEGPFLVVGLARSGQAIAGTLTERGEEVIAVDSGNPAVPAGLQASGVEIHLNADGSELLRRVNTVIKSPGVPQSAPAVVAAREAGLDVMGELEVAWRMLPNRFVAVTGTNGKTTVAELLGHLWREGGRSVVVAGNVGTPLASLPGQLTWDTTVVAEASSFQLEDSTEFAPDCAVFLNLAPDHLDRHGDLDAYLDAKLRIFANQANADVAVINGDEPALAGREIPGQAARVAYCRGGTECEVHLEHDVLVAGGEPLLSSRELQLLGAHNIDNAMAAAAAALAMGLSRETVASGLRSFTGVPHRLERLGEIAGVLYVNDSKATNVTAAVTALNSFEAGVHLIVGGRGKGESFEPLLAPLLECGKAAYLIGEAAEALEGDLAAAPDGGVALIPCTGGLDEAVARASEAAQGGDIVLLAPACASFDAYADFEARGEHFRSLVEALR